MIVSQALAQHEPIRIVVCSLTLSPFFEGNKVIQNNVNYFILLKTSGQLSSYKSMKVDIVDGNPLKNDCQLCPEMSFLC